MWPSWPCDIRLYVLKGAWSAHKQVFVVAAKRSSKAAAWAPEYARLCALFRQEALRLQLEALFQDALYGCCLEVLARASCSC